MAEEAPEAWDTIEGDPDASWLAGTGEYSATGGGTQPLHRPGPARARDAREERIPDVGSLEEMYRYSLARATQDAAADDDDASDEWGDGPLHVEVEPE